MIPTRVYLKSEGMPPSRASKWAPTWRVCSGRKETLAQYAWTVFYQKKDEIELKKQDPRPDTKAGFFSRIFKKLKEIFPQLKANFCHNSRIFAHNSRNFRHNSTIFVKIPRNFTQKAKNFPITQGIFANNSIFRKIHLRRLPENPGSIFRNIFPNRLLEYVINRYGPSFW